MCQFVTNAQYGIFFDIGYYIKFKTITKHGYR